MLHCMVFIVFDECAWFCSVNVQYELKNCISYFFMNKKVFWHKFWPHNFLLVHFLHQKLNETFGKNKIILFCFFKFRLVWLLVTPGLMLILNTAIWKDLTSKQIFTFHIDKGRFLSGIFTFWILRINRKVIKMTKLTVLFYYNS